MENKTKQTKTAASKRLSKLRRRASIANIYCLNNSILFMFDLKKEKKKEFKLWFIVPVNLFGGFMEREKISSVLVKSYHFIH